MSESNTPDGQCYHCGQALAPDEHYPVRIDGRERLMCCPGCQAVAEAIVDGGLERFYAYRESRNQRPDASARVTAWQVFDRPELQADFVLALDAGRAQANLLLEGISCAACSWLIERHLAGVEGLEGVTVNVTSHRCQLVYHPEEVDLSRLMAELAAIGYRPRPATDDEQRRLEQRENRLALARLGVAGFGMMQAGMVAVGLYTGAEGAWQALLRWLCLLLTTPVVLFSAWPFFRASARSLRAGALTMDVPVALAVGLGYLASAWATVTGTGDVYFESIAMFVFFLLVGRYLEMRARARSRVGQANVAQLMPASARRLEGEQWVEVPVKLLAKGDRVRVAAGGGFPADGRVLTGQSSVDESLLSGESNPVPKALGQFVVAGSQNIDSPLEMIVTAVGHGTQVSAIERLIERAGGAKPRRVALADRVARYFVAAVLLISAGVFGFWWFYDSDRALWVALSVLVVTCPCALALSIPAAHTAAADGLRRRGVLLTGAQVLETLPLINRVVFDKTGTLTNGQLRVVRARPLADDWSESRLLAVTAALEEGTSHPIARAFADWSGQFEALELHQQTGLGVTGLIDGQRYRLGRPDFVCPAGPPPTPQEPYLWLLLAGPSGPLGYIGLADDIRPEAAGLVADMRARGLAVELLSGDRSESARRVADQLGIDEATGDARPEDKLSHLDERARQGDTLLAVGDGINDVPVLSRADLSVAMARASELAQTHADCLLLRDSLAPLAEAFVTAHRTRRIVRQNLALSLMYNGLALPLAALGLVPPWAAALGMTASSLVVVLNALRLRR